MTEPAKDVHKLDDEDLCSNLANKRHKDQEHRVTTATEMVTQMQGLFESTAAAMVPQLLVFFEAREKELKEREEACEKRLQLYRKEYQAGNDSDLIHLNVGGSTKVIILRRALTYFENSKLALQFSGRWDDTLAKDQDGNFFIDQDPNVFLPLLNYLRHCDQKTRQDIKIEPPPASFAFCSMLEYYGLMSSVYPQEWRSAEGSWKDVIVTREHTTYDSITISNSRGMKRFMLELEEDCPSKPANATAFTVVFENGSRGYAGWLCGDGYYAENEADDDDTSDDDSESDSNRDVEEPKEDSFSFEHDTCRFLRNGIYREGGWQRSRNGPVTIQCTRDVRTKTYSIQVRATVGDEILMDSIYNGEEMIPHITFEGKVTISNVLYSF